MNEDDERKSVRFKLEKELKINFEMPTSVGVEDSPTRKSPSADSKQIEIDFEDLHIDLNDVKVPKDNQKTAATNEIPSPWTKDVNQDKSSRSYKKSINIVLNGKSSLDNSVEDKKSENLIDFTDRDSVSTADSRRSQKTTSGLPEVDDLVNIKLKNKTFMERTEIFEASTTKNAQKVMDEILKVGESESGSSQTINENTKVDGSDYLEYDINLERTKQNLDAAKAEKLKALEGEFNSWVKNTEKMFRDKEKQSYNNMREKYEDWKKNEENGMIKEMGEQCAEELQGKVS